MGMKIASALVRASQLSQLALLERTPRLDGFEVLLDRPSASIDVDDPDDLLLGLDRLCRGEHPVDWFSVLRWIDLADPHHVEVELLGVGGPTDARALGPLLLWR